MSHDIVNNQCKRRTEICYRNAICQSPIDISAKLTLQWFCNTVIGSDGENKADGTEGTPKRSENKRSCQIQVPFP